MKLHIPSTSQQPCYGILLLSDILHQLDKNQFVFSTRMKGGGLSHALWHVYTPKFLHSKGLTYFYISENTKSLWNCLIVACLIAWGRRGEENIVCGLCNEKAHDWASLGRPHPEVLFCLERPPSCAPVRCYASKNSNFLEKKIIFKPFSAVNLITK